MQYSWAWDVTPDALIGTRGLVGRDAWPDKAYVRLRGLQTRQWIKGEVSSGAAIGLRGFVIPGRPISADDYSPPPPYRKPCEWTGRIIVEDVSEEADVKWRAGLDECTSRFAWQSVTGLLIGTLGLGVFAFFLVRWLKWHRVVSEG